MKIVVQAVQLVWLGMWPVLGGLAFLLFVSTSLGPRDPKLAGIGPVVLILGGAVVLWVGFVTWQWLKLRRLAFSVVDTSLSPAALPGGLAQAAAELQRLGFTPIGRYTVETAWPEGTARVYATYISPQNPGTWADLSYATLQTSFCSYWANGADVETLYPGLEGTIPKVQGAFPNWMLIQHSSDGIEAAHRLHLGTLARLEQVVGVPLPVPDLATAIDLLADGMRRIHEFHRAKLWTPIAQTLFVVPAWLGLAWFVVTG